MFVNSEYRYTRQNVCEVSVKSRCTTDYIGRYKYISVAITTEYQLWYWLLVGWVSVEYQIQRALLNNETERNEPEWGGMDRNDTGVDRNET